MPAHDDELSDGLEDVEGSDIPDEPVIPARKPRVKAPAKNDVGVGRVGKATGNLSLDAPFHSIEAEALWPEILERLYANGRSPQEISIRVIRVDPPPRMTITSLEGTAVSGSEHQNAGDALIESITDNVHLPMQRTPARYDVQFVWKINGKIWKTGTLPLASPDAILAMRRALQAYRPASGVGQAYSAPPAQYSPPNVAQNQFPAANPQISAGAGFGAPYYNPREAELQAALQRAHETEAYLKGQLERAGLQPQLPQTLAAPPPSTDFESRLNRIESMLERLAGVGQPPQVVHQVQPQPQQQSGFNMQHQMNQMMNNLQDMLAKQMYSAVEKSMKSVMTGVGAPKQEEDEPEEEEKGMAVVQKPSEEDELPFKGIKVPEVKWPDGSDVYFSKEKEGIRPHPVGMLMHNPYLATKVVDVANKLGESVVGVLKSNFKSAPPPPSFHQPQVPLQIPMQASQLTNTGMGQPMPQPVAAPEPHHEFAATNGAGGLKFSNGWG